MEKWKNFAWANFLITQSTLCSVMFNGINFLRILSHTNMNLRAAVNCSLVLFPFSFTDKRIRLFPFDFRINSFAFLSMCTCAGEAFSNNSEHVLCHLDAEISVKFKTLKFDDRNSIEFEIVNRFFCTWPNLIIFF